MSVRNGEDETGGSTSRAGEARPVIGVTCEVDERDARARRAYMDALVQVSCAPMLLFVPRAAHQSALDEIIEAYLKACSGIVLTGGSDPATEEYPPVCAPTHPEAKLVDPDRQRFETALLRALERRPDFPVLGVCLGMQMMALCAGGELNQHMPDDVLTHAEHMDDRRHAILASVAQSALTDHRADVGAELGVVTSWHRQAVRSAGTMRVIAKASDGVIEAIDDPKRAFCVGVQWHPERTDESALGLDVFARLANAARAYQAKAGARRNG